MPRKAVSAQVQILAPIAIFSLSVKTVKLIAKPNTWFKEGTEVFDYDEYGKKITLDYYKQSIQDGGILVRGIRICENPESEGKWHKVGEEYEDGEYCSPDEFFVVKP